MDAKPVKFNKWDVTKIKQVFDESISKVFYSVFHF